MHISNMHYIVQLLNQFSGISSWQHRSAEMLLNSPEVENIFCPFTHLRRNPAQTYHLSICCCISYML